MLLARTAGFVRVHPVNITGNEIANGFRFGFFSARFLVVSAPEKQENVSKK
jgi:hypothetical protein